MGRFDVARLFLDSLRGLRTSRGVVSAGLAAARRNGPFVDVGRMALALLGCLFFLIHFSFSLKIFFFCPTPLPTIFPVTNQEMEAKRVDFHARLETDAKVAVIHLILVNIGMKKVEVAGYGEEKVIIVRR
jgi:hypothetical protein